MIHEAAQRCVAAGIRPSFNIIFGFPGETEADRRDTTDTIRDMCERYPGVEFWTNIFTPYPASSVMGRAKELGIEVPDSLEAWTDFFPRYTVLPWLRGREHHRVQNMREYLRFAYKRETIAVRRDGVWRRRLLDLLRLPARWRLRRHYYDFPLEIWALNASRRLVHLISDAR
jgi:radical SAM superfamily enzyme YgiQ (UPF0313 family)